jgi:2-dehydropantoate 2-reductase
MKQIESVLIAGAGAIGLSTAGTLFDYDKNSVAILASGERLKRYRADGLFINNVRCDFAFADPNRTVKKFDLVLFATKYHHLKQAIADVTPFVGPETILISLLNGISSENILGEAFNRELPLAMIIATDAQHTGQRTDYTTKGIIHFGDAAERGTERDERIRNLFSRAGVAFVFHKTGMKRMLWYKFMLNVGLNQTTALLRLPYGPLKQGQPGTIPEARALMFAAMRETIAVANTEGVDLNDGDMETVETAYSRLSDSGCTSMCQDVLAGRKTEVELFALTVMELGRKHGIPTPVNETLYYALRAIEQSYGASARTP